MTNSKAIQTVPSLSFSHLKEETSQKTTNLSLFPDLDQHLLSFTNPPRHSESDAEAHLVQSGFCESLCLKTRLVAKAGRGFTCCFPSVWEERLFAGTQSLNMRQSQRHRFFSLLCSIHTMYKQSIVHRVLVRDLLSCQATLQL